ncbi:MAG: cyclic nucleotide-binding domain-containing protein [Sphingomonadaceae bacterium]|nr:cyclic nucleotide-binding domain-containing protein [Sphingomonadaceae bacterium]
MSEPFDIIIVGSGPAGLSAAGRAAARGLSYILLEKTDHLSDTIFKYQKGKHIMATPVQLELRSDVAFDAGKREAILGEWDTAGAALNLAYKADVSAITGEKGNFTVAAADGRTWVGRHVILAIGTQGNPNRLAIPGADLPHIQYTLDDPGEYIDEHITVVGGGDAGIENALGLAQDEVQGNIVTILNRDAGFVRAKGPNVAALMELAGRGRITPKTETSPSKVEEGWITLNTRDGEERIRCDRIIARLGSAPPRKFVESCGIEFTGPDREAFPRLTPTFETTTPGIFVIGALAGYPLIKHCMNQGHDVVEFIAGNTDLRPVDEKLLSQKFAGLPGNRSVDEWLDFLGSRVAIFADVSPLQLREFMLDSETRAYRAGDVIFERNEPGSSLFAIADGSVLVEVDAQDPSRTVPIETGSIFGEVGLISGRRRGATIRAGSDAILVEMSRAAALKLMKTAPGANRAITRISLERQLLQIFGAGLTPADLVEALDGAEVESIPAGKVILTEGDTGDDIYIIRQGSMIVEKNVGGRAVFLRYLPAGSYVGEMGVISGDPRNATIKAAIKSEVVKLPGAAFRKMLDAKPDLKKRILAEMADRQQLNAFMSGHQEGFSSAVELYSKTATFLIDKGIGEATDVLLIDEKLCVGCDNCERACADSHEGLSRLDREAGATFAHIHVPTSCRHCEHPHCMSDCPPNAIHRGPDGEVYIDDTCIGCGNCQRYCPYGVIRMDAVPPEKPSLLSWLFLGRGPGPGEPTKKWVKKNTPAGAERPKKAIKCDMCSGLAGGPACVRACPTGAAIRVSPEAFLSVARLHEGED